MAYDHLYLNTEWLPLSEENRSGVENFFWTPSFGRGHWEFHLTEEGTLEVEPNSSDFQGRYRLADAFGTIAFCDWDFEYFFKASVEGGRFRYIKPISADEFEQTGVSCSWYSWHPVAAERLTNPSE